MLIDILIPTYNRVKCLVKNLELLQNQIITYNLYEQVKIIISDNCSPDDTEEQVEAFSQRKSKKVRVKYFRTDKNIGLERNAVQVLSRATAHYLLWTGDDDFIADGYLHYCVKKVTENPRIGCILAGIKKMDGQGQVSNLRNFDFEEQLLPAGFETMLQYSHFAHQMSGLLLKRENLLENYLQNEKYRTPYLFIYFTTNRMAQYPSIFVPKFKTIVTIYNRKDWSYNQVGLLDQVYRAYFPFIEKLGKHRVKKLLLRFTMMHSYRLNINTKAPLRVLKQYRYLARSTRNIAGFRSALAQLLIKEFTLYLLKQLSFR